MTFEFLPTILFAASVFLAVLGIILLSGFLPMSAMPAQWWTAFRKMLLGLDALLVALLVAVMIRFAAQELHWAVAVIAAGLAGIAAPPIFQIFPAAMRNTAAGLVVIAPVLAGQVAVMMLV